MSLIRIFAVLPLSEKQTLRWFTFRGKQRKSVTPHKLKFAGAPKGKRKVNIEFFEYNRLKC